MFAPKTADRIVVSYLQPRIISIIKRNISINHKTLHTILEASEVVGRGRAHSGTRDIACASKLIHLAAVAAATRVRSPLPNASSCNTVALPCQHAAVANRKHRACNHTSHQLSNDHDNNDNHHIQTVSERAVDAAGVISVPGTRRSRTNTRSLYIQRRAE